MNETKLCTIDEIEQFLSGCTQIEFTKSFMGKFKAFDEQAHEAAHEMAKSAQEKEAKKVISAFQSLQSACLSCHQTFRPAFVEHFYGKTAN